MGYLAIQVATFMAVSVIVGIMAGWWMARFLYQQHAVKGRIELAGLRRNYDDSLQENISLRHKLRCLEKVVRKASVPPSETDYGKFLQLRKALEKNRRQYESLLEQFHQQEKMLAGLKRDLQDSRRQLDVLRVESHKQTSVLSAASQADDVVQLHERDDLTCIQGVNPGLASKLQALGILSYRQLAEFTVDDVRNVQRIIDVDVPQAPDAWIQSARSLFQQKCQQLQAG
ncbi:hypothetical protein VSS37_21035 [Candidatus Thiothrix sp. Deng01]|uniref:DUF4332 domain-containing protein n=1 Tax=Candidatus Thiothrix phosphatis TaxID=3112415 RepID=A0ABU6D303_9GAMM|nr:hypothetical protein [Candidatus Thiothrix sp. Deng01]MEB4593476.1 hypothetical protein [Candidatus Thiothrix sp. Deng01]